MIDQLVWYYMQKHIVSKRWGTKSLNIQVYSMHKSSFQQGLARNAYEEKRNLGFRKDWVYAETENRWRRATEIEAKYGLLTTSSKGRNNIGKRPWRVKAWNKFKSSVMSRILQKMEKTRNLTMSHNKCCGQMTEENNHVSRYGPDTNVRTWPITDWTALENIAPSNKAFIAYVGSHKVKSPDEMTDRDEFSMEYEESPSNYNNKTMNLGRGWCVFWHTNLNISSVLIITEIKRKLLRLYSIPKKSERSGFSATRNKKLTTELSKNKIRNPQNKGRSEMAPPIRILNNMGYNPIKILIGFRKINKIHWSNVSKSKVYINYGDSSDK